MKKLFLAFMAVAMVALVGCDPQPTPDPIPDPDPEPAGDYPVFSAAEGEYVIVINFEGPICEGAKIAFPNKTYCVEGTADWATDLEGITYMEEVTTDENGADFTGKNWYKVSLQYGDSLQGKPALVPADATAFDWNYQTGDFASWTVLAGEPEITAGFSDEANICFPVAGVYVMKSAYWKKQVNPCDITVFSTVKFILHMPTELPEGIDPTPTIHGAMPLDWGGLDMVKEADGTYTYEATEVPDGTEFQFTLSRNWDYKAIWEDAEYNCTAANFSVTGPVMEITPTMFAAGCPAVEE